MMKSDTKLETICPVLAIDLGLKRCGLAISDPLGISVRALPSYSASKRDDDRKRLEALVVENSVVTLLLGFPKKDGSKESVIGVRAKSFARYLSTFETISSQCTIFLVDEAQSSKRASMRLAQQGKAIRNKRHARDRLDSAAAAILVEDFLTEGHWLWQAEGGSLRENTLC